MKSFTRLLTFVFFTLVVIAGFIFVGNNTTEVNLWLVTELEPASVGELVIAAFIVGGLLGLLLGIGLLRQIRNRVQVHQLKARLKQAEARLDGSGKHAEKHRRS